MSSPLSLLLTCPKGLEGLLAEEASALGAEFRREIPGGVFLQASQETAYRLCLWSRLANRVLLILHEFDADDGDGLYAGLRKLEWDQELSPEGSFAVDFQGSSRTLRNTHYGALRCRDALVDYFQARHGLRPNVDKQTPDLRLHVRLQRGRVLAAIDLSGDSLHRRGYREQGGRAPLKENLAAALLLRADWPGNAARGGALIDPLCGSGTLLIEGAMMAMDIAPGLLRRRWGFDGWLGHVPRLWQRLREEAEERRSRALQRQWPEIRGYDGSAAAVAQAEANIERAGLTGKVRVLRKELAAFSRPTHRQLDSGLVITNPPYGERLSDEASLVYLYQQLGAKLREEFVGWQAAVFTANLALGKRMGLRSHRQYRLYNADIPARLLLFNITPEAFVDRTVPTAGDAQRAPEPLSPGAQMFANRLRKNRRRLEKWLQREQISCYRLYDADMPEYAVAVDCYEDQVHVAEYAPPASVDAEAAQTRLREVLQAIPEVLSVNPEQVAVKERRRQRGVEQYRRSDHRNEFLEVREGAVRLLVNLHDYLDTGLFLDHRRVRLEIARLARGKRFLNLFCYTASASVHAAQGGAASTTSVDLSKTYLDWARRNLALNGFSEARHHTAQADCLQWLTERSSQYDLILLDPPTFSNSKRMEQASLDVQRDHATLIDAAMARLQPEGLLIFSCNRRDFRLDESLSQRYRMEDRTAWSIDQDFNRPGKPIHHCWFIRK